MTVRYRIVAMALAALAVPAAASAWPLVTAEEEQRDNAAPHDADAERLRTKAPPTIELTQPDISAPLHNPVTMEVRFHAGPGASIDMTSVRAAYGWLGFDITKRLLQHAVQTADGLIATDVEIPPGDHKVTVSVADTAGRVGSRTFQLTIAR
jgi:hypothetical protein